MLLRGIYRIKYINNSWLVDIDGYQMPFPDAKTASQYLDYINLWADNGQVVSYDFAKQHFVWFQAPNVRVGIASKLHRGKRMRTTNA